MTRTEQVREIFTRDPKIRSMRAVAKELGTDSYEAWHAVKPLEREGFLRIRDIPGRGLEVWRPTRNPYVSQDDYQRCFGKRERAGRLPPLRRVNPMEITNKQIRELRREAASAGDFEQVKICDAALRGDDDARAECAEIISEAAAMENPHGIDPTEIMIINPEEALAAARSKLKLGYQPNPGNLWIFSFGAYGDDHYAYWDDGVQGLEGSLEEVAGYLADNAPGHLTSEEEMAELYKEAAEDHGIPWPIDDWNDPAVEQMREDAEADMTYTESGWLTSYEWTVNEVDPKNLLFSDLFETSIDDAFEDEGMDDEEAEEANEVAKKLGLDAEWEPEQ